MLITRSGLVLEKVCEYFYYNEKYKNAKDVPDMDFPLELSLEVLMAADYLNGAILPLEFAYPLAAILPDADCAKCDHLLIPAVKL